MFKLLALSLCLGFGAHAQSTADVWNHHIEAWEARSIEAILSDYTEDSVLILNNETHKGTREIAKVFERLFAIFDGGANRIDPPLVFDRFVYISWHFTPYGEDEHFGTDTFVIENGKIILQTIGSSLYSR